MTQVNLGFFHGLGDLSNFARLLPLYKKYGIDVGVKVTPDKECIIKAAGARLLSDNDTYENHPWFIQNGKMDLTPSNRRGWECNKTGVNMRHYGLQDKVSMEQLWEELKNTNISIKDQILQEDWNIVDHFLENWPKPITLWHSIGNTNRNQKSFTPQYQKEFTEEFLHLSGGTLLLLDWDNRVTWTNHHRLKHSQVEFGSLSLTRLAALMFRSQLMIGIDSGPFYFSTLTSIPTVGVYFDTLHPAEYMIPHERVLSLTVGNRSNIDAAKRFEFQILDFNRSMKEAASICATMLKENLYTSNDVSRAADVQLQTLVRTKCRGKGGGISSIYDRDMSFNILLSECKKRFKNPKFVETGCARSPEDWGGAGYSTILFARYCQLTKGHLTSFDLSEKNVNFSQQHTNQFKPHVDIILSRGDDGLKSYQGKIDVLYLDSLDTEDPNHCQCNLDEFKSAEDKLHEKSIVIIDDTPTEEIGKGALTVKYMKQKGWKYLYRGYQVVMSKV